MSEEPSETSSGETPRLPVYLDGELLEALAQTLDPSGIPGTRRVRFSEGGRTIEGSGVAVRASGRIGGRLLGAQLGGDRSANSEAQSSDDQSEEQEFVVREATLLWQAYSILKEEGHIRQLDAASIGELAPGDWVEFRTRATSRSLTSLSRLLVRVARLQSEQSQHRLERLREGEALLRGSRASQGMRLGEFTMPQMRELFLQDLVASLAAASDPENLQAIAAIEGFADELLGAVVSDIRTQPLDPALAGWAALLTVRTEHHDRLATAALHDAEFGVFGKVTLVRRDGAPVSLVRRTMLDWMETTDLANLSSDMQKSMGAEALTVDAPLIQVLPLALLV